MKVIMAADMAELMAGCPQPAQLADKQALVLTEHVMAAGPAAVLIMAGPSANGTVGCRLAFRLAQKGIRVTVAAADKRNTGRLKKGGIVVVSTADEIAQALSANETVIDCLYGCELTRPIRPPYAGWIDQLNGAAGRHHVISADIPSGINGDSGTLFGAAVKADVTVAMQWPKAGCYRYPAAAYCGTIITASIGLKDNHSAGLVSINDDTSIRRCLPVRQADSHKGSYGKVLLIAGHDGTTGACLMCAEAILRSGAGLLTVMSYPEVIELVRDRLWEAMTVVMDENPGAGLAAAVDFDRFDLIVIGPGLGRNEKTAQLTEQVLKTAKPCVADADALFYLPRFLDIVKKRRCLTVITPHQAEYDRIFSYRPQTAIADLARISRQYPSLVIVLKGPYTLIGHKGRLVINTTGCNALAKGGSGDVLTGIVAGFMAARPVVDSVIAAVYVHSKAADYWVKQHSGYSLLATDLIKQADRVLFDLSR